MPARCTTEGRLDPVPPELVGRVDISQVQCPPSSPLGRAKQVLFGPWQDLIVRKPFHFVASARRHQHFVAELLDSRLLLKKARKEKDLGFAKFFTVVKKVDETGPVLRTILDCQSANDAFIDPDPVNLASLHEILDAFASVEKLRALDLRHFYHQICIGTALS